MTLTVVMIARDDESHVPRALGTVLSGRPEGVEVVFVDDASTDATLSVARGLADGKPDVKVLHSDRNVGIGGARNIGVAEAAGDYILFHDSDDYLSDGGLGRVVDAIREGGRPDVVLLPFRILRKDGHVDRCPSQYRINGIEDVVGWAVGPWSAALRRELYVPMPERVYAEGTAWHYLQYDRFGTFSTVAGDDPVYVWDCTNPAAVTRTVEYFEAHSHTLEELAFGNALDGAGLKDAYVSDSLRNLAEMYDVRHRLTKQWVKNSWAVRFRSCWIKAISGHYGH